MTLPTDLQRLLLLQSLCAIAVLVAIALDLVSGLQKAKSTGQVRTSYAYSRTTMKIITNLSAVAIAAAIDLLLNLGHLWQIVRMPLLSDVPVLTVILTCWLCFVQLVSIRESAEDKANRQALTALQRLSALLGQRNLTTLLQEIQNRQKTADEKD